MRPLFHAPTIRRRLFGRAHLLLALTAMLGAALLTLVNVPRALACPVCISPNKITLSGDGIVGTASVTDPGVLAWFSTAQFMGFEQRSPVARPVHTGLGIELTRDYQNSGVPPSFWTVGFDHMRYYPGPPGKPGFVLYEGVLSADGNAYAQMLDITQRTGHWYALTSSEDDEVRQLLAAAHANPQQSSASSQPLTAPVPPGRTSPPAILTALTGAWLPVVILLACLALLVASVGYRRLWIRRHPGPQGALAAGEDAAD